ncbi:hypothetical protein A2Z67_01995 [Candidatus Woesebacteria bacterium RBG_13_36_22]|uniref:Uncharacterized protein n=1 Tax=Candidatus Woesebacteria bacterium RBG_13_36_22 TaxID=1802478 RepID=A0A1F7X6M0_9BACT|nr:MAG: hypothetical protein A2Z67_01995 [Candidatus Woesebacteria bacterium RBG_13_36_22]
MLKEYSPEQLRRLAELDPKVAAFEAGMQGLGLDVFDDPETGENLVSPVPVAQTTRPAVASKPTGEQSSTFVPNAFGKTGEQHPHAHGKVVYDPQARY